MTAAKDLPPSPAERQETVGKAFVVVTRARKALPSGDGVSEKTARNYRAKADRILLELQGTDMTVQQILARYAPVSRSFYAMRAALVWHCKQECQRLLSDQDVLQRREGRSAEWLKVVGMLEHSLKITQMVENVRAEDMLEITGEQKKAKHSKRKDLPRMPRDWKERMLQRGARSPRYGLPTLVIAATGCRPEELVKGVDLRFDGSCVVVKLHGAKVSEHSGQEWRQFKLQPGVLPIGLVEQIKAAGNLTVSIKSTDAFRTHLTRLSAELFPGKPAVTGYSFRHSLAEDLREAGWDAEELAAVLGQTVSETQAQYGRKRRAGSRTPEVAGIDRKSIETARPVRPLDRSGLDQVKAKKSGALRNLHPK